jgi:hypothetical protein
VDEEVFQASWKVEVRRMSKLIERLRTALSGPVPPPRPKVWKHAQLDDKIVDTILRRAEKGISYLAKRVMEIYIRDVYLAKATSIDGDDIGQAGPAFYLFEKIAGSLGMSRQEQEKCGELMAEYGMLEFIDGDDLMWLRVLEKFPNVTVGGKKLHESSKVTVGLDWCRLTYHLHAKWSEEYGLSINREDIESFDGTNLVLKECKCDRCG